MNSTPKRILIGSPIHQKPAILREFLSSLLRLHTSNCHVDMYFIDDNEDEESRSLLMHFANCSSNIHVERSDYSDSYLRDEHTHYWSSHLVWKVASFKDRIISYSTENNYDYLFLIDSDLVLHPQTLTQLVNADKDIISEIFWTKWQPDSLLQPQVWMHDEYNQWDISPGETLTEEEKNNRFHEFLTKMRVPGIYNVGGLGACTLISTKALNGGVNFNPIYNLTFWGEDRHFCIRAAALGFTLYVDTHFPAYHIYRDTDLEYVKDYKIKSTVSVHNEEELITPSEHNVYSTGLRRPKLTLSMVVRNEGSRFLKQVLTSHRLYIDEAVIIDDGSTDETIQICTEVLEGIPFRIIHNKTSKFSNEIELRKQQWTETVNSDPEWILNLDADELFEQRFAKEIHSLLLTDDVDLYCFRLYDFWDDKHYREDQYWHSHFNYRPFIIRYKPGYNYEWRNTPQHCGRLPSNVFELPHRLSDLRLKHLGWSRTDYRNEKYNRYLALDPDGIYGWKEQYLSILDEHPNLILWQE